MKIEYDIEIPQSIKRGRRKRSEEYNALFDFVESEHKTMCLEYDNKKDARLKVAGIRSLIKYRNISNIKVSNSDNKIYIIKEDETNKLG